ncbi:MAG: hypothetical protein EPO32_09395 [Anaerolineae bacterium]|nr:MAG: hypothetical protein EPO32_09395 [Anaerolineae bacterium]
MILFAIEVIFGIYALVKKEIKITNSRILQGDTARNIGILLLAGAAVGFFTGALVLWGTLIAAVVWGFIATNPVKAS